jgi:hypothetical protein
MNNILISLVSDQTIPNILAIHHFKPDELLFITTETMEDKDKVNSIIKTLSKIGMEYKNKSEDIVIEEDSILDCHRKIEQWIQGKEDSEFIVNLTCGTKIMSIAAYEYFKDYTSRMIYIPINRNDFIIPFPKKSPGKPLDLELRLSVVQYLTAYGLAVVNESRLDSYHHDAVQRSELSQWIVWKYEFLRNLLVYLSGNLRTHRDDKEFDFTGEFSGATTNENELLRKLGFDYVNKKMSKKLNRSEIRFLTGGWLEEYCFNKILKYVDRGIDNAVIGIEIVNKQKRNNEFDIMFTKENALYFIECKSLDQHDDKDTNVLYKIGALQKEFGLRVNSFLVTTSPYILKDGKLRASVQARAEQFNTRVITPPEVYRFEDIISEVLNIHRDVHYEFTRGNNH